MGEFMKDKLIKNYIDKLSIEDLEKFANSKSILLTNSELNYVYSTIKDNWETIIYGNPTNIFNEAKENLNTHSYNKIIDLYNLYKIKYQNFL